MRPIKPLIFVLALLLWVAAAATTAWASEDSKATYRFEITTTPEGAARLYGQLETAGYGVESAGERAYHLHPPALPVPLQKRLEQMATSVQASIPTNRWSDPVVQMGVAGLLGILALLGILKVGLWVAHRRAQERWWNEEPWIGVSITTPQRPATAQGETGSIDLVARLGTPPFSPLSSQSVVPYGAAREQHFESFGTRAQVHLLRDRLPPRFTLE